MVEELSRELPSLHDLRHPVAGAGLRGLARRGAGRPAAAGLAGIDLAPLQALRRRAGTSDAAVAERLSRSCGLAATYFLTRQGPAAASRSIPVARFHLGNGARLERLNWLGDISPKGLREAHGLMVNYLYDLRFIEANHEAFANDGTVVASDAVLQHLPAIQPAPETVA